ncbi:hypothetical protein [Brevundimonas sp. GCM10030266]|uniref:hypothetical protein n=1 Tax=Brevundimonas sp. GCM10030266 TaxID=3273386 RepID=UPI00360B8D5F
MRLLVRGEVNLGYVHQADVRTAVMGWAGHHIYVVNDDLAPQRIPMDKLIPGELRGGVDVGLTLVDVREAEVFEIDTAEADD